MKTFLNVLYRRILYKIPLKLLLVLLAVFGVLFASFSNAELVQTNSVNYYQQFQGFTYNTSDDLVCMTLNYCDRYDANILLFVVGDDQGVAYSMSIVGDAGTQTRGMGYCTTGGLITITSGTPCNIDIKTYNFQNYTSMQCQTEYNLIPVESVDENYCTSNNLCPSCPSVPVGTGGYSQLYINNILHLGAPNIIMNIPDEIDWDYAYTQGGQNMNIDVVGYNVDYEKIDQIVQLQNYKPTSEDFQKIIGLLAPYTKIIVFFVFLFIVWAWIKKPFKSKKL